MTLSPCQSPQSTPLILEENKNEVEQQHPFKDQGPKAEETKPKVIRHSKSRPHLSVTQAFKNSCYLCGNLGHHANECEFDVKVCYNCGQSDHKRADCTEPKKNNRKQCFYCKEVGHVQSECPRLKLLEDQSQLNHYHAMQRQNLQDQYQQQYTQRQRNPILQPAHMAHTYQHQQVPYNYIIPGYSYFQSMTEVTYSQQIQPSFIYQTVPIHPPPIPPSSSYTSRTFHTMASLPQSPSPNVYRLPSDQISGYNQRTPPRRSDMVTPINQHFGNHLLRLRSYSSETGLRRHFNNNNSVKPIVCYNCGKSGHESRHCPLKNL